MWCVRSLSEVCGTLYNTPAAGIPPALAPSDMGVPDLDLVVSRVRVTAGVLVANMRDWVTASASCVD